MSATWQAAVLVLRDLLTAAALLWLTISDSWAAIAVSSALVLSRMIGARARQHPV